MKLKLLNKLERKLHGRALENLMLIICVGQMLVFIGDMILDGLMSDKLALYWPYVMNGELWRCIGFVFVPSVSNPILLILELYFYYMIGGALEHEWGSFNFNIYYLLGVICCNICAAISGYATSAGINLALFFAFAILFPDYQLLVLYVFPVKVKWLALFDAVLYLVMFILFPGARLSLLLSFVPLLLFFWNDLITLIKRTWTRTKNRVKYRQYWK